MKLAVVDDFEPDRKTLIGYLNRFAEQHCLAIEIDEYSGGNQLLNGFRASEYKVIFLDVYMGDTNGLEIARRIREIDVDCLLIFSSVSDRHAVDSFRVRAFYYLLKPYTYGQLEEVMSLCDHTLQSRQHYIEVREGRTMVRVLTRDIIYADYTNHYIQIHTLSRMIRSHMYFTQFQDKLLIYPQFLYCYRNCIVNLDWVSSMEEWDFVLQNGERLPVTRNRRLEIRQKYADFVFDKMKR